MGPREKTFSPVFYLTYFPSPTKQWKNTFSTQVSSPYFLSSLFSPQPNTLLGSIWLEEWKNGRLENCGRMEKWEDRNYLVFPLVCLVGGVEKWECGKLFYLVGEKKGKDGKCNIYKLTIIPLLHNM